MDRGKRYESVELLAVVFLAILLRLFAGRNAFTENGVLLNGFDDYYHMRRILYSVSHFPSTLWFDSYLDYPKGLGLTWPPLFDQLSAALSLGFGQHTQSGIELVSAHLPLIIGAVAVIIVYLLVRELFDRNAALLSAFMTAIAPYYLQKTMIGSIDHHSLEVLLVLSSLLLIVLAITRSERRRFFAVGAGFIMAALAYAWLGASLYLGLFLIYAAIQMTVDLKRGESSRETAITLLTAFGVALVLLLPFWNAPWLLPSFLGLAAVIVMTSLLFLISSLMAEKKISWIAFPLATLVLISAFLIASKFLSGLFNLDVLIGTGVEYIFGGEMTGKIGEAEGLFTSSDGISLGSLMSSLGWKLILNLLFSLAGMAALISHVMHNEAGNRQGRILLLAWAIFVLILTIGQIRFLYISTISMGILISILFFWAVDLAKGRQYQRNSEISKAFPAILLVLLLLPTVAEALSIASTISPVAGDWQESLDWLKENSKATSFYDDPDKVPEYSIMSSWSYGNWIVYISKRPVVANNFQAGLADSAKFFLSESEAAATAILDARGSKYILVDYDMIFGKLSSMAAWANEDPGSYLKTEEFGLQVSATPTQRLLNTILARLYLFDGAGAGHFRLIHESSTFISGNPPKSKVKIFEYVPGALIRVKTASDQRVGALLNMTSNQGRIFTYVNEGLAKDGYFEIRIPYSTEGGFGTHALDPYLIFSGNENGVKMQNVQVSEQDVLDGRIIDVSF